MQSLKDIAALEQSPPPAQVYQQGHTFSLLAVFTAELQVWSIREDYVGPQPPPR